MSDRPSIEDGIIEHGKFVDPYEVSGILDALAAACVDGPLVDRDRGIIVHRADPELADDLRTVCAEERQEDGAPLAFPCGHCWYCRAACMIGGTDDE